MPQDNTSPAALTARQTCIWIVTAVAAFHLAYEFAALSWMIGLYLFGLVQLSRGPSAGRVFQSALLAGLLIAAGQLWFFFGIFNLFALFLWLVVAAWTALFVLLVHVVRVRHGRIWAMCCAPFFWLGIEYFRCEENWLRFTWLIPGYAFAGHQRPILVGYIGVYGVGFLLVAIAAAVSELPLRRRIAVGGLLLAGLAVMSNRNAPAEAAPATSERTGPRFVAIQAEFPQEDQLTSLLDRAYDAQPGAELVVLSEYTFKDAVPDSVLEWCRVHGCYLIAGGRDRLPEQPGRYYNTAFVVSPEGEVVFKQAKCVPIQFMADGLAARDQQLWSSPWGKIGICICYDLSYRAVVDELIGQGARLLIVPTMDVTGWGRHEHELHAKVGPTRAAEYGVPILRVCSSGISQAIDAGGVVRGSLPFPGQGETLAGRLQLAERGNVPPDRWLGRIAMVPTGMFALVLFVMFIRGHDVVPRERTQRGR